MKHTFSVYRTVEPYDCLMFGTAKNHEESVWAIVDFYQKHQQLDSNNSEFAFSDKPSGGLLAHIAEQVQEYKENILLLYPDFEHGDDNGFEVFDSEKNEFLENLWDVIMQHFDDDGTKLMVRLH